MKLYRINKLAKTGGAEDTRVQPVRGAFTNWSNVALTCGGPFAKFTTAIIASAAIVGSTSASGQSQERVWLVCYTSLDVTRFAAPPIHVAASEIPALENAFRKRADHVGNSHKCTSYPTSESIPVEEQAGTNYRSARGYAISVLALPDLPSGWGSSKSLGSAQSSQSKAMPIAERKKEDVQVSPKYVEVPGPRGIMKLSPEVAARNKAAADEHQRKLQEHADAVAKAKAENQASAERLAADRARHAESMAKAAAEKREYERRLTDYASKVAAHKAASTAGDIGAAKGGEGGIFQATGMMRDTKETALATLTSQNLPPLFDVKCDQVKFFNPPKWACWGFYRQTVTKSSTSKQ